jgi:protoheme IX farnesyltransferase
VSETQGAVGVEQEPAVQWANEGLLPKVRQKIGDYRQLVKFRLTVMVLSSGLVGFWLASGASPDWSQMSWFALGTFLIIGGANAFNQVAERANDRLMQRTASRPLPAERMRVGEAVIAATMMSVVGLAVLHYRTHVLTVILATAAMGVYLVIYTPLKRLSHWSTLAGAVSGAIPPLMGWSAVRNGLDLPAWALFGIVFFWQFPHTWSIASAYREDFTRAGYQVLPLIDPDGRRTRALVIFLSLSLAAVSLLPAVFGVAGSVYVAGATLFGIAFVACAVRYGAHRTRKPAMQLMAASLFYMPLILTLLLVDRRIL